MKTTKLWSILVMFVLVLGTTITFFSCSKDSDDSGYGGGVTIDNVVGSYKAFSGNDYSIGVIFADNGTGLITKNRQSSYSGSSATQTSFTYSMAGTTGFLQYNGSSKSYPIRIVDGFLIIEESDGDIEFILYKDGTNLGSPNTQKVVGTWSNDLSTLNYTVTFNGNGSGLAIMEYRIDVITEKGETPFTYKMLNSYLIEVYTTQNSSYSGNETYTSVAVVLGNKMYLLDNDGNVDKESILTRK